MPDPIKVSAYAEISTPSLDDILYMVDDPTGAIASGKISLGRLFGTMFPATCQGRLTTETGVPVSTSDRTAQSTLYFTPYVGNRICLYDGVRWKMYAFTERSLALSGLTSGKNYDVFLWDNSGTLALELSAAWTNDTTRADAITLQDGVYVKSSATTRRYLGTVRTTGTTTIEDSLAKRFVWNMHNRVTRPMKAVTETADSWTYTLTAFRQANANAANQLAYVVGIADQPVRAKVSAFAFSSSNINVTAGIGIDSSTVNSAPAYGTNLLNFFVAVFAEYLGIPGIGYHELRWLEASTATGTTNWYGDNGQPTQLQ